MLNNNEKKTYVIDIDGTICTQDGANYMMASPIDSIISICNRLFDRGNKIIFFTARGSTTGINWKELTERQLNTWGVKYHELIMGKPFGDFYIDDKAILPEQFRNLLEE
jgi:histidinol phosphatase-like enzyme